MVEISEEFKIVFWGDKKKITILSFGSMYPNDNEIYLRDLQSNLVSVSSDYFYYEYRGPIFLKSEIINFSQELYLLLQKKIEKAELVADEEEMEIKVECNKGKFQVSFIFLKNDLIEEKWQYETSFEVDEINLKDIYCKIKNL
ncbi:hypothetical protein ACQYAD_18130 [Neobacillus sp. SM06]|uniref:hypothetical protein n=1 Tax=Neobacillus sp. SM06 TaxID=3422492 RepID=UPI003D2D70B1